MINVRNRQYATDGKTSGYPTLSSIYWNYLESQSLAGIQNDNFTYQTMIDYVNGMGDYWIRLVEQMIPATTIWNTGVKLENSIFHRQKFVWRRQRGCDLVPILCNPCKFTGSIYLDNCTVWSHLCNVYPDKGFDLILSDVVNTEGCDEDTISSDWFVDITINGFNINQAPFFHGSGLYFPNSVPNLSDWETALNQTLQQIYSLGYDYRYETIDNVYYVRIWDTNCATTPSTKTITINVGIQYSISCQ
jgi:hypothetical protein